MFIMVLDERIFGYVHGNRERYRNFERANIFIPCYCKLQIRAKEILYQDDLKTLEREDTEGGICTTNNNGLCHHHAYFF
jgi:hypothetical protein